MSSMAQASAPSSAALPPTALPPLRSYLFVPVTDERKIDKALASKADALIFDLEDAVAISEKDTVRRIVEARAASPIGKPLFIRVNGPDTPWCFEDLHAAVSPHVTGVILPKVESAASLVAAEWVLASLVRRKGLPAGSIGLSAIIETAQGVASAQSIAAAGTRPFRLFFGAVDLASDMDLDITEDDSSTQQARFALSLASRLAGIGGPVDTAHVDISNLESLAVQSARARAMGYSGKACIHPAQIEPVNRAFSPKPAELDRARRIVSAFEEAEKQGIAALKVDGVMVDYPVVELARRLLSQAVAS